MTSSNISDWGAIGLTPKVIDRHPCIHGSTTDIVHQLSIETHLTKPFVGTVPMCVFFIDGYFTRTSPPQPLIPL